MNDCPECEKKDFQLDAWRFWAKDMSHQNAMLTLKILSLQTTISLLEIDLLRKELGLDEPGKP